MGGLTGDIDSTVRNRAAAFLGVKDEDVVQVIPAQSGPNPTWTVFAFMSVWTKGQYLVVLGNEVVPVAGS